MKYLIFITGNFPWGKGESFIENEFPFLNKTFDKIWIISNTVHSEEKRNTDRNTDILYFSYGLNWIKKVFAARYFFSPTVFEELFRIKCTWNLSVLRKRILTLLFSYAKGKLLARFILKNIIYQNRLSLDDIWVYSYWLNDMATGIALLKKKHRSVKAFSRAHRWDVYHEQSSIGYLPLRQFIIKHLDAVYPISLHARDRLQETVSPENWQKIKHSPLGTQNNFVVADIKKGHVLHLVSCSGLVRRKRVDRIIDALALLDEFSVSWSHLGGGDDEEIVKQRAFSALSQKTNIQYEFKGSLKNQEVLDFYKNNQVNLFINTSQDEGVPVSVMEAFSFGIPAIAPDVGAIQEIIDTGKNGYLLSPNPDASEIADCLTKFLRLSEMDKRLMGTNAYFKWQSFFYAETNFQLFVSDILSL